MAESAIDTAIAAAITSPLKASGDSGSMEGHRLTDLIAAAKYLSSATTGTRRKLGMRILKIIPGGTA